MLSDVFERVLVIAPHADDEVLGCGGLIKKVLRQGGEVHVVVACTGDIEFGHLGRVITKEERKAELGKAMNYLGVTRYYVLFDDYESLMDTMPIRNVVSAFESFIKKIRPTAVLLPYPSFHQDHKVVFNAGFAALRPTPSQSKYLKLVACYEYPLATWSNESLQGGGLYVDISQEIDDKIKALRCHGSQIREGRHLISPETVLVWAEIRGLEAGFAHSEFYYVLRMLA